MTRIESIRFGAWLQQRGRLPSLEELQARYPDASRATLYRMRDDAREAFGIEREPRLYLRSRWLPTWS